MLPVRVRRPFYVQCERRSAGALPPARLLLPPPPPAGQKAARCRPPACGPACPGEVGRQEVPVGGMCEEGGQWKNGR